MPSLCINIQHHQRPPPITTSILLTGDHTIPPYTRLVNSDPISTIFIHHLIPNETTSNLIRHSSA
ncbi:hypothetical protein HanRHA438_Chr11g0500801 [Helianthus annuus]|nr:hypothetical protein HanRHA438_Chr11g0500801 [Helianthus annuus]